MERTLKEKFEDEWEKQKSACDFKYPTHEPAKKVDCEKLFDQLAEKIHSEKKGDK